MSAHRRPAALPVAPAHASALAAGGLAGSSDLYTVKVTILQGTAVYPYATVIDPNSTDPIVVTPTEPPLELVPRAGHHPAGRREQREVAQPGDDLEPLDGVTQRPPRLLVRFLRRERLREPTAPRATSRSPGQTLSSDDFVKVWLTVMGHIPVDDATSYQESFLDVSPARDANTDPLLVLGETYNAQPAATSASRSRATRLSTAPAGAALQAPALTGLASTQRTGRTSRSS